MRTEQQKAADNFDADLYRLISASRNFYLVKGIPKEEYDRWVAIHEHLMNARSLVRRMMHKEDRTETTGW